MAPKIHTMGLYHFLGVTPGELTGKSAFLRLWDLQRNQLELFPLDGSRSLSFQVTARRLCPGRKVNKDEWVYCGVPLEGKYKQCFRCSASDFQKCFIFCDADKSKYFSCFGNQAQRAYCYSHRRAVYLVSVGSTLKVGISFHPLSRWIAQGAEYGAIIAWAKDGFLARRLEVELSTNVLEGHLTQMVSSTRKLQTLNGDEQFSRTEFLKILSTCQNHVRDIQESFLEEDVFNVVPDSLKEEFRASRHPYFELPSPEIIELRAAYGQIEDLTVRPRRRKARTGSIIRGVPLGVKGNWLVLKNQQVIEAWNWREFETHVLKEVKESKKSGLDKYF